MPSEQLYYINDHNNNVENSTYNNDALNIKQAA